MHMVIFAVKLHKLRLKITANIGENAVQIIKNSPCKHSAPILGYKDQMDMHSKNAMSSSSYFVDISHRPTIIEP